MMKHLFSILFIFSLYSLLGQSNTRTLNPLTTKIFTGDYDPADYAASVIIDDAHLIAQKIHEEISTDSLLSYLLALEKYETRNSGSDTVSDSRGIGAARRYIADKFRQFSQRNENRLIVDYLEFDQFICGMTKHRNVLAVLPGRNSDAGIVLIEGHMDSRCESVCDVDCLAEGMEDNGSGTALVMELARVMSSFTFDRTLIFMTTTAEEQGLLGANAMARYMRALNADIKAVLNNDVIGGITCGETSSPPSCPGLNHIDSTQVRIFSFGGSSSFNKSLARYCKLQYEEELLPHVTVPMQITIMSAEDRTGRGGDHIPFREQGYTAIRFTSANEHGDAGIDADYHDRQHSTRDVLGVDRDGDGVVDSFFVDFNYLARNAAINGVTAALISASPDAPSIAVSQQGLAIRVTITDPRNYDHYRIGIRSTNNDFDTLITVTGTKEYDLAVTGNEEFIFISAASVDDNGIESCFSNEERLFVSDTEDVDEIDVPDVVLLQNRPNPFDEATIISWVVNSKVDYREAFLVIRSLNGKEIYRTPADLQPGLHEIVYTHGYLFEGMYTYSLVVDGRVADSKTMIFAY